MLENPIRGWYIEMKKRPVTIRTHFRVIPMYGVLSRNNERAPAVIRIKRCMIGGSTYESEIP